MRAAWIRTSLGMALVSPWIVAVACGGQQESAPPPTAPIVVATAAASASPPSSTREAASTPSGSGAPSPAPSGSSEDDPLTAQGNMWGDAIGDAFGAGGLGLGGDGGSIGHGAGTGTGQGFGSGHGRLGGSSGVATPKIRQGTTTVSGKLPPEVIQRIVRQNFGRYRLCYENGLRTNPKLAGRVTVRFVIGTSGDVESTKDNGSDMPDKGVIACVVRGFGNLSFPQPESGKVTVDYPIHFAPGDAPAPATSSSAAGSAKPTK